MKMILAPHDHADIVREELGPHVLASQERLFLVNDEGHSYWAQNVWTDVEEFKFDSISEAAKHLRAIQRNLGEVSVAPMTMRFASVIAALAPETSAAMVRAAGAEKFAEKFAAAYRKS